MNRRQFFECALGTLLGSVARPQLFAAALLPARNPGGVQFRDVSQRAGIHFVHERAFSPEKLLVEIMGAGCGWLDYNQDGFLDAILVNSGKSPNFRPATMPQPCLYRNNGDGTFTDVTKEAGLHVAEGFYFGVAAGDFDNDGYPDIYMTGYDKSVLFRNNRDGTFSDVTHHAGVANEGRWGTAAGWFDFDHDGFLDLLVANYVDYDWNRDPHCGGEEPELRTYCDPFHFKGSPLRLYHNNGDGTFSDWTERAGLKNAIGKGLGLVLADFDGDGWDDILVANDGMPAFFYRNQRDGTFKDATFESGAGVGGEGEIESAMGIDAADVSGHGSLDFYVGHMDGQLNRMYQNNGSGDFTDVTMPSGLGRSNWRNTSFGLRFFDWDNDGNRDLLVVNGSMLDNISRFHPDSMFAESKILYRNLGGGRFTDVTDTQANDFTRPYVGRGLAVGDYDNDGALDFLQSNNGGPAQLFLNEHQNDNHWIGFKLVGTKSNRDAVGTQVRIKSGKFESYDQVKGGGSYCSSQDLRLHFGIGNYERIELVEIKWPSGSTQTLRNPPIDRYLVIEEARGILDYAFPGLKRMSA